MQSYQNSYLEKFLVLEVTLNFVILFILLDNTYFVCLCVCVLLKYVATSIVLLNDYSNTSSVKYGQ